MSPPIVLQKKKKKLHHLDIKFLKYILAKYMGFVSLCIKLL